MNVNRGEQGNLTIELDGETAEALQTVLATVTDRTGEQGLDRLYILLDQRNVMAAKVARFEDDPNYDPEEVYGHQTMLVIEDLA